MDEEELDGGEAFRPVPLLLLLFADDAPLLFVVESLLAEIEAAFDTRDTPRVVRLGGDVDDDDLDVLPPPLLSLLLRTSTDDDELRLKCWFRSLRSESGVVIVAIEIVFVDDDELLLDEEDGEFELGEVDVVVIVVVVVAGILLAAEAATTTGGVGNDWIGRLELVVERWWWAVLAFANMDVIGESINGHELLLEVGFDDDDDAVDVDDCDWALVLPLPFDKELELLL